jgi:hypothetical protein
MNKQKQNKKCKVCLCMTIATALFCVVLLGHLLMTIEKVSTGHGLDVFYITFFSPKLGMTYISALIYYIIFAVIIALSPLIYWFSAKEERSFKKKYHIDE